MNWLEKVARKAEARLISVPNKYKTPVGRLLGQDGMTPLEHWNTVKEAFAKLGWDRARELHDPDFCEKCGEGEKEEDDLS